MTKLAIISDIHGNADALKAVLKDITLENVDDILNLGDHFSGPLAATETAEILMAHNFQTIQGNHDRTLITQDAQDMGLSDRAAYDQLPPQALAWIEALPKTFFFEGEIFMCHGVPENDLDYFLETVLDDGNVVLNTAENIAALASGITAKVILCGHTHIPRIVHNGNQLIINPGSVGLPAYHDDTPAPHNCETGSPHARYAILEARSGLWQASLKSIPYNNERMVELAGKNNRPDWVSTLQSGRIRS